MLNMAKRASFSVVRFCDFSFLAAFLIAYQLSRWLQDADTSHPKFPFLPLPDLCQIAASTIGEQNTCCT